MREGVHQPGDEYPDDHEGGERSRCILDSVGRGALNQARENYGENEREKQDELEVRGHFQFPCGRRRSQNFIASCLWQSRTRR